MTASYFEFHCPVKILSGHKALENLPYELQRLGASRPLFLTDLGVAKAGLLDLVTAALRDSKAVVGAVYDRVPADSSVTIVQEAAAAFRQGRCDSLVAVGGGSVMDTAKAVNILVSHGGDDLLQFSGADRIHGPLHPLIVLPTTAGTGSEVTLVAVIANPRKRVKMAFASSHLYPQVAILDPRLTLSLPKVLTAATAMDALTHAVEAYLSIQKNPLSDAYATTAVRLIVHNLPHVLENGSDTAGRLALANAACCAGIAFSNAMVGIVHALGHAAGALCHIHHGTAMNIFLPHGLEYNLGKRRHAIGELLLPLGGHELYATTPPRVRAEKTIEVLRVFQGRIQELSGLPTRLRDADVPMDMLESIAATALNDGALLFNPEDMTLEEALYVLQRAY
ncbi:iron-containing alcohol dehydrogenase [Desulfosoma caldarium]|uniref:Alcohol dehydrogenase n=1 Tax=Desulfosoma caldarium TaxID=610254 RepID=A0A3N1VSK6_9BACT|nr:iron-containing alcohol dehydrogenase [Desulfosoma caldarium]ROR03202.1 alcohol dehydrogenase [Desulfosoma caldarium]